MRKLLSMILAALFFAAQAGAQNVRINEGPSFGEITIGSTIVGSGTATRILFVGTGPVLDDSALLIFDEAAIRLTVGTGSGTSAGWHMGYGAASGVSGLYSTAVTPDAQNAALFALSTATYLNAPSGGTVHVAVNTISKMNVVGTAGSGPAITAGTAADNTPRALSASQTWTDGTSGNIAVVVNVDQGATGTGTGKLLSLQSGASGTTDVFNVNQAGTVSAASFTSASNYDVAASSYITFLGRVILRSPADSVLQIGNNAESALAYLSPVSTGILGIGTGASGSFAGRVKATSAIIAGTTIANLNASPTAGEIATITDQTAACPAKGVAPTAGGALVCVVYYTGAAWAGI